MVEISQATFVPAVGDDCSIDHKRSLHLAHASCIFACILLASKIFGGERSKRYAATFFVDDHQRHTTKPTNGVIEDRNLSS
jgi:hypothetical protein